ITPAAGFVAPMGSFWIGIAGGFTGFFFAVYVKHWLGYDDSLDAFGVHGMCGIVGAILTAVFASPAVNELGTGASVSLQLFGIGVTIAWCAIATLVILMIVKLLIGLRVDEATEIEGLDYRLHGESVH
ncbi:MAG TPA: ammonia channel protein, partial [Hyphomicrobiaceae bacterium]|nr:ammonia channel protein [Hyphomicrobiaceae bacterium]